MAYAYKQIDDMLQPSTSNIFGGSTVSADPAASEGGNGTVVKATTEGSLAAPVAAGAGSPSPYKAASTSGSFGYDAGASAKAAYAANAGKTDSPYAFTQVQNALGQKRSDFEANSNNYLATEKAKQVYSKPTADIDAAVNGDDNALTGIQGLLGKQYVDPAAAYQAPDVTVNDTSYLSNNEGLGKLASRGQNADYTRGMSAFDVNVLRRDPNFQSTVNKLTGEQQALRAAANDAALTNKAKVEDYGATQLDAAKQSARTELDKRGKAIDAQNVLQAQAANAALKKLREQGDPKAEAAALADARARAKAVYGDTSGLQYYDKNSLPTTAPADDINVRNFVTYRDDYRPDEFMDSTDTEKWNRILGLLGDSGVKQAAMNVPKDYTIDTAGLSKAVNAKEAAKLALIQQQQEAARRAAELPPETFEEFVPPPNPNDTAANKPLLPEWGSKISKWGKRVTGG